MRSDVGGWKDDLWDGPGELAKADGTRVKGEFRAGQPVEGKTTRVGHGE